MTIYNDCILFLLAKAYQKAHGNMRKHLLAYALTPIQTLILETLGEEEGLSAGDIGKRLVLDSATLSGVLDRLAEAGWIIKLKDPEDKRIVRIYLTDKAKDLGQKLTYEREQANNETLGSLTLEEAVLLKRLLRDISG